MNMAYLKKCFPLLGLVSFMVFSGCSQDKGAAQGGMPQMPPALVETIVVEQKDVPFIDSYVAKTEGSKAVEVRAQVSGILKEKRYSEGQFVQAGTVLFVIEQNSYIAALDQAQGSLTQAQANLKQAKLNYERAQNLFRQNAMSKKDYDAAQAAYDTALGSIESAKAAVSEGKIRLGYTNVIAPVSGYTSKANSSVGNLIAVGGAPLTVINQVDPLYVNFSVPSSTMSIIRNLAAQNKLKTDDLTVRLKLDDGSMYSEIGKVTFFDKQINSATSDIKVRAEFPNPNLVLLPGQFVTAYLDGFTLTNALVIPQKSLLKMGNKTMVIVVDESNIAHYRPVATTINLGNDFLVESGIKAGERIIVEGQNKVAEGGQVRTAQQSSAMQ